MGETLAEAGDEARVLFSDIEPARVAEARAGFPFSNDRRPQAYRR